MNNTVPQARAAIADALAISKQAGARQKQPDGILTPIPLVEPVNISKALLAHREAKVVLSGGVGPVAAVHLVNIGLTGWTYTEETATAYAEGYNTALKQYRTVLAARPNPILKARAEGRAEALEILIGLDAEAGLNFYTGWGTSGAPDDEGSPHWEIEKLRELFHVDDELHNLFDRAESMYWEYMGNRDEAERATQFANNAPGCAAVRKILEESQRYELLHDLMSRATPAIGKAACDVFAERRRQVEQEGYDPEHDDAHPNGEIAAYAAYYAMPPAARDWPATETGYGATFGEAIVPDGWGMPETGDRRRELVKAGALILAEIERIDRADTPPTDPIGDTA
jgi:hypothetical protein